MINKDAFKKSKKVLLSNKSVQLFHLVICICSLILIIINVLQIIRNTHKTINFENISKKIFMKMIDNRYINTYIRLK